MNLITKRFIKTGKRFAKILRFLSFSMSLSLLRGFRIAISMQYRVAV